MKKRGTRALTSVIDKKILCKFCPKSKRSQLTIFIIIGILIIVLIALFFLFRTNIWQDIIYGKETNPDAFLSSCLEDKVKDGVYIISEQGGYISNPLSIRFKFEGEHDYVDISYLCYSEFPTSTCMIQEGNLIGHLKDEIENYIDDDVENCFRELELNKQDEGYVVDRTYNGFEIDLKPKKIIINIDGKLVLTKARETSTIENFKIIVPSRFYDLVDVVQKILSDIVINSCQFDNLEYITPEIMVEMPLEITQGEDFISFYTVKHKDSEERFRFAVKNCVG